MERFYPLHVWVCGQCFLVQLEKYVAPEDIFSDYAYFSSFSESWVEHARTYADLMIKRFGLGSQSKVMEIASNDGYLLQHFKRAGLPCLGIEPAANVARAAIEKGIPTTVRFFGEQTARAVAHEHGQPDLLLGNNVLAHVPDINDFVKGMKLLLKMGGVITMEFPHLQRLIEENQFDTIYHEHFSYLSITTVSGFSCSMVSSCSMSRSCRLTEVRCGYTGSTKATFPTRFLPEYEPCSNANAPKGSSQLSSIRRFSEQVMETKRALLEFLIDARRNGKKVVGYGAPGKGNTLLNYCGIRQDFLDFTVDLQSAQVWALYARYAYSDPASRRLARGQAGLCAHTALEPAGGDCDQALNTYESGAADSLCRSRGSRLV